MSFLGGDAVVGEVDGDLVACLPASGGGAGAGGGDGLSRLDVFSCVSGLLAEGDEECGGIGGAAVGGCGGVGMDGCYEFIPGTGGRQYEGEAQGCQCEGECGGYEFLFHCYAVYWVMSSMDTRTMRIKRTCCCLHLCCRHLKVMLRKVMV